MGKAGAQLFRGMLLQVESTSQSPACLETQTQHHTSLSEGVQAAFGGGLLCWSLSYSSSQSFFVSCQSEIKIE